MHTPIQLNTGSVYERDVNDNLRPKAFPLIPHLSKFFGQSLRNCNRFINAFERTFERAFTGEIESGNTKHCKLLIFSL